MYHEIGLLNFFKKVFEIFKYIYETPNMLYIQSFILFAECITCYSNS